MECKTPATHCTWALDYDNENYTTDLWIAEGFTAYYQNRVLCHANLITPDIFLTTVAAEMSFMENQPAWHGGIPDDKQFQAALAELEERASEWRA